MPRLTPPPNMNPHMPRLQLPEDAVDCHIHLFGPASEFESPPDANYLSGDATAEMYFAIQAKLGLSRAVLVSGGGYGQTCTHLVAMLRKYPDRLRGVVRLPVEVSLDEIKMLNSVGVRAARFFSRNIDEITPELLEMLDEVGWHVQFYCKPDELLHNSDRLLDLNRVVVLDHFGHNTSTDGVDSPGNRKLREMLDTGRIWTKISGPMRINSEEPPYPSVVPIARMLVKHAPERLVWGSDWPHTNMWDKTMPDDGDLIDMIQEWIPDEKTRKLIFVENPSKLYNF